MAVRDGESCRDITSNHTVIAWYLVLRDGIDNILTVVILRKVRKRPFPAILSGNGGGILQFTIGVQPDGDGIRALSFLIVCVVPDLAHGNVDGSRLVRLIMFFGVDKGDDHAGGDCDRILAVGIRDERFCSRVCPDGGSPAVCSFLTDRQGCSNFHIFELICISIRQFELGSFSRTLF